MHSNCYANSLALPLGIEWAESTLEVGVGEDEVNSIVVTPEGASLEGLEVTASAEGKVTITPDEEDPSKFTFTGVEAGEVTITATLGELTDTFTLTVTS